MASALENFVNNVRTLSASGKYLILVEHLNESLELLTKNWNILDNVLETLDIQQHSLGVLYVLIAKFGNISNNSVETGNLVKLVKDFITLCNGEQVRFAKSGYYELCHLFTNYIVDQPSCIQGIQILVHAVDKIRLFDSQLTPIHADLCQLCLKAICFKPALKFLNVDITDISNTEDVNNDSKYFLLYYYYGGMIYTAVKNYERALEFFEVAVSTPAMSMSHIMLESYKKFIIVSLIHNGKMLPIPKYASQVIARFMKPLSQAYHDLATAYGTTSSEEVRSVINKYRETFTRDHTVGLAKQVALSLYKKNIQRLTKTFLTLSLVDVADRVQLSSAAEAENYILNMIKSGEIYATINQKEGMVVFKDDPEKYDSPQMFLRVQQNMKHVMELSKQIIKMEEDIMLNPMYVKKSVGNQEEDIALRTHSRGFPTE